MDRPPKDVFTALERSGHWTGLTVALVGTESRMSSDEHAVTLEFLGNRSTGLTWGRVSVAFESSAMQLGVEHTPVGRWFLALGALGTVGATGGDRAPANSAAPTWSWHPAEQGLVAGLWSGRLDVGEELECMVRIEPYHRHPSDPRARRTPASSCSPGEPPPPWSVVRPLSSCTYPNTPTRLCAPSSSAHPPDPLSPSAAWSSAAKTAQPAEEHHRYSGPVYQGQRNVTNNNRGLGRSNTSI